MVFIRQILLASVRSIDFYFFFLISARDLSVMISYRFVPRFQTTTTFTLFIQIQRNQRPCLHYDPLYRVKQLKHVFESLKFELGQILIQTSFDHNLSFVAPFELILFANQSS